MNDIVNKPKETSLVANPFGAPVENHGGALAHIEAQKGVAEVQAAMMIALRNPRNQMAAYDRIMNACSRPKLAETATYSYSKGGTEITGPTIRLAEVLAQNWGNIEFGWREVTRGGGQSEILAYAWDLETNVRHPISFVVKHWRDTKKGGYILKDEREIYELCANQAARRLRKCLLDIMPSDIIEAALDQCALTLKTSAEITKETIKAMLERFAEFKVTKEMIEARIQRRIDTIQPAQFIGLRKIYNSLKDAMSKPEDWFETPEGDFTPEKKKPDQEKTAPKEKSLENFKEENAAIKKDKAAPQQGCAECGGTGLIDFTDPDDGQIVKVPCNCASAAERLV